MLSLIKGLPQDVLGVEALDQVTHEDYRDILIPAAEAKMARGPVKMLYVVGSGVTGYDLEAMWDDAAFGIKHWSAFGKIAVVTDNQWLRIALTMFRPFFPSEVRLFAISALAGAKAWISERTETKE